MTLHLNDPSAWGVLSAFAASAFAAIKYIVHWFAEREKNLEKRCQENLETIVKKTEETHNKVIVILQTQIDTLKMDLEGMGSKLAIADKTRQDLEFKVQSLEYQLTSANQSCINCTCFKQCGGQPNGALLP